MDLWGTVRMVAFATKTVLVRLVVPNQNAMEKLAMAMADREEIVILERFAMVTVLAQLYVQRAKRAVMLEMGMVHREEIAKMGVNVMGMVSALPNVP